MIYRITDIVLLLVMLVQTVLNIFSGEPSTSIKVFGKSLGIYLQQISEFLSYASDEKPFPFSDWPTTEDAIACDIDGQHDKKEVDVVTLDDQQPNSIDTGKKS